MKWGKTEADVMENIKISLQYRKDEKMNTWKAADFATFQIPVFRLEGTTKTGNRILWFTVKYSDPKNLLEDGKKALSYLLECLSRTEPNKPVSVNSYIKLKSYLQLFGQNNLVLKK